MSSTEPMIDILSGKPLLHEVPAQPPVPYAATIHRLGSADDLHSLALEETPVTRRTAMGSVVKFSRNKARMAKFTYVIADPSETDKYSQKLMSREQADAIIARQTAYIEDKGRLLEVRAFLGVGRRAVPVQWLYTPEAANIAAMQRVLGFPPERVLADATTFAPMFRIVYTPDLRLDDMPGRQAIIVDLENWRTHIIGPDYFGESKKAALRMLNALSFAEGGLTLHAGAKLVHLGDDRRTMTVMGLSGTGKTTTTFSRQGCLTQPVQDDMVTLWPEGELSVTENGCFAKTFGLTAKSEPVIHAGTMSQAAWLENVYINPDGTPDFFKEALSPEEVARHRQLLVETGAPADNVDRFARGEVTIADVSDAAGVLHDGWEFVKWTANGRSIMPMSQVEDAADLSSLPPVRTMGILNRDEGADAFTPGIVRFTSPAQAAGYFMLGETTKTSAAGKEVGKTRSPFTQPFFPQAFGLQAGRFRQLAATMAGVDLWMMNTGYVGGDGRSVDEGEGYKVKIRHSSAMLEALLGGEVVWRRCPHFGYELVDIAATENALLLEAVPADILDPEAMCGRQGRSADHQAWVSQMKQERRAFLEGYEVDADVVEAVCG